MTSSHNEQLYVFHRYAAVSQKQMRVFYTREKWYTISESKLICCRAN